MSERKLNRRDFLKLAGAGIVSASSLACGRTNVVSTPERKSSESTLTKLPTETLVPTATSVLSATPIATNIPEGFFENIEKTPVIPDLAHLHLEGNVLKTEQGEYAGEIIEYIFNGEKTKGIVLIPSEVKKLMDKANMPAAIAAGNWKIPFPLDARGGSFALDEWKVNWGANMIQTYIKISGMEAGKAILVSPFNETVLVEANGSYPHFKSPGINIHLPSWLNDEYLTFIVSQEIANGISKEDGLFNLGEKICAYGGNSMVGGMAPENSQALLVLIGNPTRDLNVSDNLMRLKLSGEQEMLVFVGIDK